MPGLTAFAAAPPGFFNILEAELRGLGLAVTESSPEGVTFEGGWEDVWRANLASRVASRVLVRVAHFSARTFGALERELKQIAWGEWLPPGVSVKAHVSCRKSRLLHTGRIAELLAGAAGRPPAKGEDAETGAPHDVFVRLLHDRVTVSVDTSGELLHRRGYRTLAGAAPLRENLAAACLLALGYTGAEPLLDPCAGSGTFPVEAALIALKIPPGSSRSFAFQRLPSYDCTTWERLRAQADAKRLAELPAPIFASDIDPGAVRLCAASARAAGLSDHIRVAACDVRELLPPAASGLLVANPPYGVRLGSGGVVRALAQALKGPFRGWRYGVVLPRSFTFSGPSPGPRHGFSSGGLPLNLVTGGATVDGEPSGEFML